MSDLLRLYLANILRPVFDDPPKLISDDFLAQDDERDPRDSDQVYSSGAEEEDEDEEEEEQQQQQLDGRSQALSLNGSDWNDGSQSAVKRRKTAAPSSTKTSLSKCSAKHGVPATEGRKKRSADLGLLDSSGPKLIHGARSWLIMFQVIGQINWLGVPFYLSFVYKAALFTLVAYVFHEHFIKAQISTIVDSNYRNPIFIFIAVLALVATLLHAVLTIYSNLFNLCPLFKVLTTRRLCFIKKEVQHIVGSKSLFFMLIFHVYQGILLKLLTLQSFNEFFTEFHIGQFVLDSFVVTCVSYLLFGIIHIDFYIRICFGFWIIAMKTNLEYRFAYLQRHNRLNRNQSSSAATTAAASAAAAINSRSPAGRLARNGGRAKSLTTTPSLSSSHLRLDQRQQAACGMPVKDEHPEGEPGVRANEEREEESRSQNSLETNTTVNTTIINYASEKQRLAAAESVEQMTLNSFKEKYKLDTMDEIQKNLNTMDDHLEVCRGIQNGSLVLITLQAFLNNGALLLLAYNLLANQGKRFHGVVMILIVFNNTLLVFLCYIGDSWISYALGAFVQTVEDDYFLQGGDDCTSVKQPPPGPKSAAGCFSEDSADAVLPLNWSVIRMNEPTSEAGSESAPPAGLVKRSQSLFLIKKKDVLFCREFLHQFENHLATPWSKLSVKIHLHMLGTFVTLIAAQIIFDREH